MLELVELFSILSSEGEKANAGCCSLCNGECCGPNCCCPGCCKK